MPLKVAEFHFIYCNSLNHITPSKNIFNLKTALHRKQKSRSTSYACENDSKKHPNIAVFQIQNMNSCLLMILIPLWCNSCIFPVFFKRNKETWKEFYCKVVIVIRPLNVICSVNMIMITVNMIMITVNMIMITVNMIIITVL